MAGPNVRRLQLGRELERLRKAADVSRDAAATRIGCSRTKIAHQESGRNPPDKAELEILLQFYGADQEHLDVLEEIRHEASKKGWWSQARLPEWLAGYVGLEADATSLRAVELELIPGLLQTEEYARELQLRRSNTSEAVIERTVVARMQRQARLTEPEPLNLGVVISEAALHRCARHRPVAASQLRHLAEQARRPNVELQVLPFDAGLHGSMSGSFTLLSFPDDLLPDMVYQEYAVGGHIVDDDSVVARMDTIYNELRGQALAADESLTMLAEFADDNNQETGRERHHHG